MRRAQFKGNQKNRNKKISKEERRLKHIKKQDRKSYDVKVVARDTLSDLDGQEVEIEGKLCYFNRTDSNKPSLVRDLYIDGIYYDHLWIIFNIKDRKKLRLCNKETTIIFTGVVYRYTKKNDRQVGVKYGVRSVELIKE